LKLETHSVPAAYILIALLNKPGENVRLIINTIRDYFMLFSPGTMLEEYHEILGHLAKLFAELLVDVKRPILAIKPFRRGILTM
jgi:hypothetical protein